METYRKHLKIQNLCSLIGIAVALALVILSATGYIHPAVEGDRWRGFWNGFISGVTSAFILLSVIGIVKNLRAMRDETALKAQYVKEHDERTQQIWNLAGANAYWFNAIGLLLAAVVAGYFSAVAFICIVGCLLYMCLIRLSLKLYYSKKI